MAQDMPYTIVSGKISDLFKKIADAKVPDTFSNAFLRDTLGLKSTNDRSLIGVLKALQILDASGKPTTRYRELKNNTSKGLAIANGIREAYAPIFAANENAHNLPNDELKGIVGQVAGTDRDLTGRIFSTLIALIKEADFSKEEGVSPEQEKEVTTAEKIAETINLNPLPKKRSGGPNADFHFNIQIHLPNNGTEETYLNIFNALREAF